MSKFGYSEVISVDANGKATAVKTSYSFGAPSARVIKEAVSIRIGNDKDAISEFISALQRVKTKEQQYLCFEVFTSDKDMDIHRVNVCHMHASDIAK